MEKRLHPAITFAVGAFLLIISLPGIPEQIKALAEMLGMSGAEWEWWNYAGVSLGSIFMLFFIYPFCMRMLRFFSGDSVTLDLRMIRNMVISPVAGIVVAVITVFAFGVYVFTKEGPSFAWRHPTLPLTKQEEIAGKCRMRAIEAVGGRGNFSANYMRSKYREACLAANGFKFEQVDD